MTIDTPAGEQSFEEYILTLSPNRQILANKFLEKSWFRNTELETKKQVLDLPQDFEGYVYDLSTRPDKFSGTTTLKLNKLLVGNYLVTSVFDVKLKNNPKIATYEYVSWKHGSRPGIKGTLFIEIDGKIKYFISKRDDKYAVSNKIYDSVGGIIQFTGSTLINLPKSYEREITELLGVDMLKINKFINLGKIYPDAGMANHHIPIFAAIIDGSNSKTLKSFNPENQTSDIQIIPIERLQDYIMCNEDSFFLATIARLIAKGIIKLQS